MQHVDHNRIQDLASLIGNTPLLAVKLRHQGQDRTIYAKAENLNMTGSIKDRMAFNLYHRRHKCGKQHCLQPPS